MRFESPDGYKVEMIVLSAVPRTDRTHDHFALPNRDGAWLVADNPDGFLAGYVPVVLDDEGHVSLDGLRALGIDPAELDEIEEGESCEIYSTPTRSADVIPIGRARRRASSR